MCVRRIFVMTPASIAILSLSMSADAFAAAIGRGAVQKPKFAAAVKGGLVFGIIEAITPLVGWSLGLIAADLVEEVDHWIAFCLLVIVGGRMVWEAATRGEEEEDQPSGKRGILALIATAVGTSIDAAAVGVGLAFLEVDILVIALSIGFATFIMATTGMMIGRMVGVRFGSVVEILGGVALIGLGTMILIEHLGLMAG